MNFRLLEDFIGSGFLPRAMIRTFLKRDHSKFRHFLSDFKYLTSLGPGNENQGEYHCIIQWLILAKYSLQHHNKKKFSQCVLINLIVEPHFWNGSHAIPMQILFYQNYNTIEM